MQPALNGVRFDFNKVNSPFSMERNEVVCQMFAGMNRKFLDVEDSPRGTVMGMFGLEWECLNGSFLRESCYSAILCC
jgi:hypothetical protein